MTPWQSQKHGAQGRWGSKPVSARVQFGAGAVKSQANAVTFMAADHGQSHQPPAPFLSPLMDIPREFMPQSFDRFPYTLKDLDPADPDWAEQVEEEKGERQADLERDGQC
jgi:arylsulfatase A-like enzyme